MSASGIPFVKPQFFTDAGAVAALYKLFSYDAGTTTKRTTYSDSALSSANANPVILDSSGRASVFLLPQFYKFVLAPPTDSDPPISPLWTADNVPAYAALFTTYDISGTAGETLTANNVAYLSDGSGGLTAGRWYKADADNTYSSSDAKAIGIVVADVVVGLSGTFRRTGRMTGLSGLTAGTVYYVSATAGSLTSTAPANAVIVGKADTTTSLVLDPNHGSAGASVVGLISTGAQTFAGAKTFTSQAKTYIGASVTLPAFIAGLYVSDVVEHTVPPSSVALAMTSATIPANMLDANGRGIRVMWGTPNATGGSGGAIGLDLVIGGTSITINNFADSTGPWLCAATIIRIDSDSVDVSSWNKQSNSVAFQTIKTTRVDGLDFTGALALRSLASTDANASTEQTFFVAKAL